MPYGFTCERWMPTRMTRPDRHNEIEVNLLRTGSLIYLLGGHKVIIEAGRLFLFWAAIPHQVIDSENNPEYYAATLPLVWFLQCRFPENLTHPLLQGQLVNDPNPNPNRADLSSMEQWAKDLSSGEPDRERASLLEIQARLLRLALDLPDPGTSSPANRKPGPPSRAIGLNKAEQMAAYIARHYTQHIRIEDISRSVRLHPNYAMALFHSTFGITLVDFVTQCRLSHAQGRLVTSDDTVLDCALDAGFGSINRFNQVFKKSCGCTPRQYRQTHQITPDTSPRHVV